MLLAAPLGENPRDVAARLCAELERAGPGAAMSIASRSPGQASSTSSWPTPGTARAMERLAAAGEELGPAAIESPERILVEFVSANPTGPLHVGGGRHAAYGDALVAASAGGRARGRARVLRQRRRWPGRALRRVDRRAHDRDERCPRTATKATTSRPRRADRAEGIGPDDSEAVGRRGVELILDGVRATLERFGVRFDNWFSERDLYARVSSTPRCSGWRSRATPTRARARSGCGPPISATTRTGSLIRADGEPTYLAADVAYHWDKLERGFERLIDVLGADHHGYSRRLRAAIAGARRRPGLASRR